MQHYKTIRALLMCAAIVVALGMMGCGDSSSSPAGTEGGTQEPSAAQEPSGQNPEPTASPEMPSPDAEPGVAEPVAAPGVDPAPTPEPGAGPDVEPMPDPPAGPATYYRDVKPILDMHCVGCHTTNGVGPFELATYEQVRPLASSIKLAVESGTMPPWLPEEDCRDFLGERRLHETQIATIARWVEEGAQEGNPADDPQVERTELVLRDPDLILRPAEPYDADPSRYDDYRCMVLDHDFEQDTFITAYQVVPDQKAIVHHVLFYLVPPHEIERLNQLENEDDTPGYECFGGPRAGDLLGTVAGWVPGSVPTHYPPGSAYRIPAGSKLVMQVHYNLLAGEPMSDSTEIQLKVAPEPPANQIKIIPVPVSNLNIEAGDEHSVHTQTFPNPFGKEFTIVGTAPHMHMLGTEISANIGHRSGGRSCVIDIDEWDFNWQQFYEFSPDAYINLGVGDTITVSCSYNNSPANQPLVNGQRIEPRDVEWGDGSLDEMCLLYLTAMEPYDGVETCGNFASCNESCDANDGACTLSCASEGGGDCRQCSVLGLGECASRECGEASDAILPCVFSCFQEPDIGQCFADTCPDQLGEFWSCLGPKFYSGACNDNIGECNIDQ